MSKNPEIEKLYNVLITGNDDQIGRSLENKFKGCAKFYSNNQTKEIQNFLKERKDDARDLYILSEALPEKENGLNPFADNPGILISPAEVEKIKSILIYSYDPDPSGWDRLENIKEAILVKNDIEKSDKKITVFETSQTFVRPGKKDHGIIKDGTESYAVYLYFLLKEVIDSGNNPSKTENTFFRASNIEYTRYIKLLNSTKLSEVNDTLNFKVGAVSYFGRLNQQEHYLIDTPFKHYFETFQEINTYQLKDGLNQILGKIKGDKIYYKDNESKEYIEEPAFAYFKYRVCKGDSGNEFHVAEMHTSYNDRNDIHEAQLLGWLKVLHTGTYYSNDTLLEYETIKCEQCNCHSAHDTTFHIIFIIKRVDEYKFKGMLTSMYYHEDESNTLTLSREQIEKLKDRILNFYYPLLKPKALQAIMPIYDIELNFAHLKTAIISILVDSYAHNISAHSLVALENFFKVRAKQLEAPIYINDNPQDIKFPFAFIDADSLKPIADISEKYYKLLGLDDNTNTTQYLTFSDIIRLKGIEFERVLTSRVNKLNTVTNLITGDREKYPLPVPVDDSVWQFMRFMKGKAAFWSGVTRDLPFGGQQVSIYDLLYKEFAQNSLFAGTIAATEGIYKLNLKIGLDKAFGMPQKTEIDFYDFFQINTELFDENTEVSEPGNPSKNRVFEIDEQIKYSKYGFLRLGKDFNRLREVLSNEFVFLPGGIVGIHSFLTIIENTIRNVKHYKHELDNMRSSGLTVMITFQKVDIFNIIVDQNVEDGEFGEHHEKSYRGEHRLYRVGLAIWNEVIESKEASKAVQDRLYKGIINKETGTASLGGTSQDKICSSMLLNNKFMSVESDGNERAYFYYPWSEPNTLNLDQISKGQTFDRRNVWLRKEFMKNTNLNLQDKKTLAQKRIKSDSEPGNHNSDRDTYLFKYFNLWHAQPISSPASQFNSKLRHSINKLDNYARFKFVVVESIEEYVKELEQIEKGKERNVYRVIERKKFEDEKFNTKDEILAAYKVWNKSIFKDLSEKLVYFDLPPVSVTELNKIYVYDRDGENKIVLILDKPVNHPLAFGEMIFTHGSTQTVIGELKNKVLNYRNHGVLIEQFAENNNRLQLGIKEEKLYEFLEILFIQVKIWDNRAYQKIPKESLEKYKKSLRLWFAGEDDKNIEFIEDENRNQHTIYIVHLSFIEELFKGVKNENKMIDWFIDFKLGIKDLKDTNLYFKFSLCIISGRGNDDWYRNGVSPKYLPFVIFKPVESLMNAISDAVDFKDDFQLKYNISKTIIG